MKVLFLIGAIINICICVFNLLLIGVSIALPNKGERDEIGARKKLKVILWLLNVIFAFNIILCFVGYNMY